MKIIIAGSRNFTDYEKLKTSMNYLTSNLHDVEIVSGGAKGADALGERYAKELGYKLTLFPADWDKWGKSAGPIRNNEMAQYAGGLVAFWDGKSMGTKGMIEIAKHVGLKIKVVSV